MDPRQISTLIVDDEPIARRLLREELELMPEVAIVGEAGNGREALQKIGKLKPDLVFLDLQMPVMSGFEVVRSLAEPPLPIIVIVTAFDQHAIQAFEAGAIDYLLKPVGEQRPTGLLKPRYLTAENSCDRSYNFLFSKRSWLVAFQSYGFRRSASR